MQENEIQVLVQNEIQRLFSSDPAQAIMIAARAIEQANKEKIELQQHINTNLMPKVEVYNDLVETTNYHEMSSVAKLLNFRSMGRNNLFAYLQENKILRYNNEPYQPYVQNGCFVVKQEVYDKGFGPQTYRKTMVSQKGLEYIRKMLLEDGYERN